MDGRDVRLHLRNQEHIERELGRIADALEKILKKLDQPTEIEIITEEETEMEEN